MSNETKIESGIPIPASYRTGVCAALRAMKIGQSFPAAENLRSGIFSSASRIGIKITTHKVEDGKIRVWRIAK